MRDEGSGRSGANRSKDRGRSTHARDGGRPAGPRGARPSDSRAGERRERGDPRGAGRAPRLLEAPPGEPAVPLEQEVLFKPSVPPHGPWVFRKMIEPPRHTVQNGAYLALRDRGGALLGRGFLNRHSEIGFRLVGGPDEPADVRGLLDQRFADALRLRQEVLRLAERTDAYRLVNSEGDRLSGLVVDRYAATCVASLHSIGYVAAAEAVEAALLALPGVKRVLFRADERSQKLEKFRLPDPPAGLVETVREGPLKFRVEFSAGHKTGLFLDQRDNRALTGSLARGRRVLDLCTNAGGFALAAAAGGARTVTGIDLDEVVLEAARGNARLNKAEASFVHADLFPWLRERIPAGERWDLVVLDPPKLARTRADVSAALRTYRDMNLLAFQAVAPRGLLLTCSCSGAVSEDAFLEAVRRAAREAGRSAKILELRGPAADHPVSLEFPEGRYLKVALLEVS